MEYKLEKLFPGYDEIPGFSIPIKQLTEEEYKQDLTLERIGDFHYEAGEDFLDTVNVGDAIKKLVAGFLMCKYPDLAKEINDASNSDICSIHSLFIDVYENEGGDIFYTDLCTVINYTDLTKARFNQVLIQVAEHYSE